MKKLAFLILVFCSCHGEPTRKIVSMEPLPVTGEMVYTVSMGDSSYTFIDDEKMYEIGDIVK